MIAKAKVLVVEDDLDISRMFQFKLAENEFSTNVATNGKECLDALEADVPDVVLLDLKMPVMNGFQVLRRMRAEPRWESIPVVVCSSHGNNSDIEQAFELGATDFIIKSRIKPDDVVLKVRDALERPSKRRTVSRYRVAVDPYSGETARLIADFSLPYQLECPECRRTLVFEMLPDYSREGLWFTGHFVCLHCTPLPEEKGAPNGPHPAH